MLWKRQGRISLVTRRLFSAVSRLVPTASTIFGLILVVSIRRAPLNLASRLIRCLTGIGMQKHVMYTSKMFQVVRVVGVRLRYLVQYGSRRFKEAGGLLVDGHYRSSSPLYQSSSLISM